MNNDFNNQPGAMPQQPVMPPQQPMNPQPQMAPQPMAQPQMAPQPMAPQPQMVQTPVAPAAPVAPQQVVTPPPMPAAPQEPKKKSNAAFILIILLLIAVIVFLGKFMLDESKKNNGDNNNTPKTTTTAGTTTTTTTTMPVAKTKTVTCTLHQDMSAQGYILDGTYTVTYTDGLVDSAHTVEKVQSSSQQILDYFKTTVSDTYNNLNTNYGGYKYTTNISGNLFEAVTDINYSLMNMEKYTNDNPSIKPYVRDGKMTIEIVLASYRQMGATCPTEV